MTPWPVKAIVAGGSCTLLGLPCHNLVEAGAKDVSLSRPAPELLAAPDAHLDALSKQGEVAHASAIMWKEMRGVRGLEGGSGQQCLQRGNFDTQ